MEQLTHYNTVFETKKHPITLVCDGVYFQENIGSIFRICDAMGVSKIIFSGSNFIFSERKINKTSRSTHKRVSFEIIQEKELLLNYLHSSPSICIALEITQSSISLNKVKINPNQPIILIIGNEIQGISSEILNCCKIHTHIPMFGHNSSMNVVQALSIALYELTLQLNK
ncbi:MULTISPECIES: TrmH family RNA methyltransferase [Flavobacterium]|uniref:TrmH family RNA methyltransferase n=2 Tax=Flavobacterium TaxID=237 RepID=A0AA94F4N8_9FLAO|nr:MULTISPECIES: TrmH family RNA methyltransferase [Flavobacterium]AMA48778.1 RNA methyltransferase [Flavobacterium covae]AND65087.1 RNA methyltransferase [Flavobacterium covae]MCH4830739.1 TrmH family RNA methyltransferase [Flavobacterium columnare]MCH4833324.1 TrmH family RNA methyltransferase [Flavobacterium columnare]MCJ1805469.1 TrmH family RNA methyltransferase [Flavobacterium covae]